MSERLSVVFDVGKTLAKASLLTSEGMLVQRVERPNAIIEAPDGYRALDVDGLETWLAEVLSAFGREGRIGAIIPVAHGAAAAIVRDGRLALLPPDYEHDWPAALMSSYRAGRDGFAHTGSPAMDQGLNLGAQLHALEHLHPEVFSGDARILPWAQYWSWRLSGVAAAEVSSLGVHTDLWAPLLRRPSDMAMRRGWAERLAPLRGAHEALGPLTADWRARTGLPEEAQVYAGLHDSNAALSGAKLIDEMAVADSVILSTGTWFVSMRSSADDNFDMAALGETPGCLVNVSTRNRPVPTALFMGGRMIEIASANNEDRIDAPELQASMVDAASKCVAAEAMALCGRPGEPVTAIGANGWRNRPDDALLRRVAIALGAALRTDAAFDRLGAQGAILVDGRFAAVEVFVRALATLRPGARIYTSSQGHDLALGALSHIHAGIQSPVSVSRVAPLPLALGEYKARWTEAC